MTELTSVLVAPDISELELHFATPFAYVVPAGRSRRPISTGEYEVRQRVAVIVIVDTADREAPVIGGHGKKGCWELAQSCETALVGHAFSPGSGDRSGPFVEDADGVNGSKLSRVEALAGIPTEALHVEACQLEVKYRVEYTYTIIAIIAYPVSIDIDALVAAIRDFIRIYIHRIV